MKIEIRGDNRALISGYVNKVERKSKVLLRNGRKFVEEIRAGAFKKAIEKAENINCCRDHDWSKVYADTKDGTLKLQEDSIGLYAECEISDSKLISEARAGKIKGWSFGFIPICDEYKPYSDDIEIRSISELELDEVSLLVDWNPCYNGTSVEVRADTEIEMRAYVADEVTVDDKSIIKNNILAKKIEMYRYM